MTTLTLRPGNALERRRALLGRLPAGRMGARGEASTGEGGETPPGEAP